MLSVLLSVLCYSGTMEKSKRQAIENGDVVYLSEKKCPHGHTGYRYTSCGACVPCVKKRAAANQRKEKAIRRKRDWYYKNRSLLLEKSAKNREENRELIRQRDREYKRKNRKALRERQKEYYKKNKERYRRIGRNYRARKQNAVGSHDESDIRRIAKYQRGKCIYCHKKLNVWHVDHIIPLSKGGSNYPDNLQITCRECNSRKHNSMPVDYAHRIGLLL